MTQAISIVVCTANRADMLKRCLMSARQMRLPVSHECELLVVDNNSSDHTRTVWEESYPGAPIAIRYLFEGRRGKSYALNCALASAKGDIIFFTDDDCVFNEDVLIRLVEEFTADPGLDGIGGRVELLDPSDLPISIRLIDERTEFKSVTQLFELIPGCNMAFRRRVFDRVGGFDTRFGPGTPRIVEDSDFLYRTFKAGFRLVYSPTILIYHGHGRKDPVEYAKTRRGYMIGRGAFYAKHILNFDAEVLRIAYWETTKLLRLSIQEAVRGNFYGENLRYLALLFRGATSYLIAKA